MQVVLHHQQLKRNFLCNSDPSYVPSSMPLLLALGCVVLLVLLEEAPLCQCQATARQLVPIVLALVVRQHPFRALLLLAMMVRHPLDL